MQQAAVVSSTATGAMSEDKVSGVIPSPSSGKTVGISTSRRALLGAALAAPIAVAADDIISNDVITPWPSKGVTNSNTLLEWRAALARVDAWRRQANRLAKELEKAELREFACRDAHSGAGRCVPGDSMEAFNARIEQGIAAVAEAKADVEAAQARYDVAVAEQFEAARSALAVPTNDASVVLRKFELAAEHYMSIDELEPLIADLRRMEGRA